MRAEIETSFNMHAVDIYGLSEIIGPGVANGALKPKMVFMYGKITFILKLLIQKLVKY